MQSKQIIELLENEPSKQFIASHLDKDIDPFVATKHYGNTFNITLCLQLLALYKKAKLKLPTFYTELLALDSRSYQQASAESIAQYKKTFISGNTLIDLTAGLGVDGMTLSCNFQSVLLYDENADLVEMGLYNLKKLGIQNTHFKHGKAKDHIRPADWIYIDPDRRNNAGRKVALHLLSPNVLELLPALHQNAPNIYIKLSPLFDIREAFKVFKDIHQCFILAEKGEVKEVGIWLRQDSNEMKLVLHDVNTGYDLTASYENTAIKAQSELHPKAYFYVPNSLLLKSGLSQFIAQQYQLKKIHQFHFFTSDEQLKVPGFKAFIIRYVGSWNKDAIKLVLSEQAINQLTIVSRGVKLNEENWYKYLNVKKGGETMLYLLKDKQKLAILAKPIF